MRRLAAFRSLALLTALLLAACSSAPQRSDALRREVTITALSLLDTGYQFGGSNPEAGLDCSGLVVLVYKTAANMTLPHNAAQIARMTREVAVRDLKAGDLVFFNTLGKPYSHVGIYLGDDRFIHAPSSRGKVRVDSMKSRYFASRVDGGRSLLD
jgi:cell wall-associated NlpC family hydrolase